MKKNEQGIMNISLFASLLMHGLFFFILSHDEHIQPSKPITIELNYNKEEIRTVKPLTNPSLAPPIVAERKPIAGSPLPLVAPLAAQESNTIEANPIVVPSVAPSHIIAPPAVIERPIMGEEGGKGVTEQGSEEIVADVSDLDEPIRVIKYAKIEYPALACKGINGLILLKILVDGDGNPVRVEVIKDDLWQFPSFAENAIKAVRKWQFSKPMVNSSPVCVWYILPVRFRIE
ncbi:TonB family protein [bacterium]|nr:TonB family protein [bacterium]